MLLKARKWNEQKPFSFCSFSPLCVFPPEVQQLHHNSIIYLNWVSVRYQCSWQHKSINWERWESVERSNKYQHPIPSIFQWAIAVKASPSLIHRFGCLISKIHENIHVQVPIISLYWISYICEMRLSVEQIFPFYSSDQLQDKLPMACAFPPLDTGETPTRTTHCHQK